MRLGILGLAQSGRKTLFKLLTSAQCAPRTDSRGEFPVGAGIVPDARLERFASVVRPKKVRHAEIEWALLPELPAEERARERWFEEARALDGFCIVLRQFGDPSVYHELGSVDPARDLAKLDLELTVADLAVVETRLQRLSRETARKTAAERGKQEEVLERLKAELEAGRGLRGLALSEADEERLGGLKFLTRKDRLIVLNVDEKLIAEEHLPQKLGLGGAEPDSGPPIATVSAKVEAELAEIEDAGERAELLAGLGLREPAAARVSRAALRATGRIVFFTGNREEARAWLLRRGATALEAAGTVHSDFARGFIRAEQTTVDELVAAGSEARLRERGRLAIRGKDYVVQDGDVLHILANV